jgi:putative component of toxin-antitoxin plasmid stabilization module
MKYRLIMKNNIISAEHRFGAWREILRTETHKVLFNDRTVRLQFIEINSGKIDVDLSPVQLGILQVRIGEAMKAALK